MTDKNLNLRPVPVSNHIRIHPPPRSSDVEPVQGGLRPDFQYASSKDGKESNLLIMLHGMGENARVIQE